MSIKMNILLQKVLLTTAIICIVISIIIGTVTGEAPLSSSSSSKKSSTENVKTEDTAPTSEMESIKDGFISIANDFKEVFAG